MTSSVDLNNLAAAVAATDLAVGKAVAHLSKLEGGADANQVLAYDLAHAAAAVTAAESAVGYAGRGQSEAQLAAVFVAEAVWDVASKFLGREDAYGLDRHVMDEAIDLVRPYRSAEFLAAAAAVGAGDRHLDEEYEMVGQTFRRFAEEKIKPEAEHIHRTNGDIPEEIIEGLAELGTFGLSIPEKYDGFSEGGEHEYIAMCVATEELSRASLGAGGSLITRPEITTRALMKGGTEEQREHWLPLLASGEKMAAVAVTEPDFGSDVAGMKVTATKVDGGWIINGVKTWCTFGARADVLLLLARTSTDKAAGHKGLSLFLVPKERGDGHGFVLRKSENGHDGKMEGRPIDTIGYRGMHSYEVALDNWFVPDDCLIGGEDGLGRGFYLQMAGFENGRLQTAARAVGVMQAAYEEAVDYAGERKVFGKYVGEYQLTQAKLAKMAAIIQISRQFMFDVARLMGQGQGAMEASMLKAYVCRVAEWVTREAMQIHGGMGYAEEYDVSRYFVDARVLSIFEGADEILAIRVVARQLLRPPAT